VFVHPREPFVRADALQSSRHVRSRAIGHLLAESEYPSMALETGCDPLLPARGATSTVAAADSALADGMPLQGFAAYLEVLLKGAGHRGMFLSPIEAVQGGPPPFKGYLAPDTSG